MTTPADEPLTETDEEDTTAAAEAAEFDIADAESDDIEAADADVEAAEPDDDGSEDYGSEEYGSEYYESEDDEAAEVAARNDAATDDGGVGEYHPEPTAARIPPARSAAPARLTHDEDDETYSDDPEFVPTRRGRGGFDPEADAIARAARYTFRQRAVLGLVLTAILCGALTVVFTPLLWWGSGLAMVVLIGYLGYLRKQVRMEEEIRRRRAARLTRSQQLGDAGHRTHRAGARAPHGSMDRDTARALRRRSALVEPDDEDPTFDHLDPFDPATARALRTRTGGDIRRAAGE